MGKHSLVKQSKQTFNKTLAIALAAGMSFGGVTVVQNTTYARAAVSDDAKESYTNHKTPSSHNSDRPDAYNYVQGSATGITINDDHGVKHATFTHYYNGDRSGYIANDGKSFSMKEPVTWSFGKNPHGIKSLTNPGKDKNAPIVEDGQSAEVSITFSNGYDSETSFPAFKQQLDNSLTVEKATLKDTSVNEADQKVTYTFSVNEGSDLRNLPIYFSADAVRLDMQVDYKVNGELEYYKTHVYAVPSSPANLPAYARAGEVVDVPAEQIGSPLTAESNQAMMLPSLVSWGPLDGSIYTIGSEESVTTREGYVASEPGGTLSYKIAEDASQGYHSADVIYDFGRDAILATGNEAIKKLENGSYSTGTLRYTNPFAFRVLPKDVVEDVSKNDNGDLVIKYRAAQEDTIIPLGDQVTYEQTDTHLILNDKESGEELYRIPLTDTFIESVTEDANGNYVIKRTDNEKWTIPVGDLEKRVKTLEDKDTVSPEDFDKVKKDLDKAKDDIKDLKGEDNKLQGEIDKINEELDNLTPRVDKLEDRVKNLEDSAIKEVRDNGDGTYTIIRNNGDEVEGTIGDGQDIKEIKPNDDGTITIVRENGDESKVDLKQVTIKEENKGTPNHTVTITSPNGDTVTFNVFDKYVTDVKKNKQGNYDIYRSDVDGGKTVWKTIVLSDLRDKISNLEDRADKLEKKDQALQDEIDELKDRLGKAEDNIKGLQDKTEGLEDDVRKINAHLSTLDLRVSAIDAKLAVLEGRVGDLEDTNKKWAECYSGIGMAAIPLAIAAPLAGLANMDIPFLNQANTDIQKRLGVYNPDLAKAWGQYGGIMKAVAGLVGLMGAIGAITYAGNQCNPYNQTDDAKDTKLGQLSSKFNSAKAEASSKK